MSADELREFLAFAEDLARQASDIAKRLKTSTDAAISKDDSSPVTVADEQINQLVIDAVKTKFPNIGVLAEEQSYNSGKTSGLLWVCDPIDGTLPYILEASISTFCLALVDDGAPVLGVIYVFDHDDLYSAAKGLGVRRNGEPFMARQAKPLPVVDVEWWFSAEYEISSLQKKLYAAKYQTVDFSSSGYAAIQVALGRLKGVIQAGNKPWDIAATKAIFDELGYAVTDLDGNEQRYDQPIRGAIVSDGLLQKELFDE